MMGRKESHAHRGRKRLAHRARHGQWADGDSGPDSPVPDGPGATRPEPIADMHSKLLAYDNLTENAHIDE